MTTNVEVQLSFGGRWRHAELTDERHYGHPVIVLEGEHEARGPAEILFIRSLVGSDQDMLDAAKLAGYCVIETQHNQPCAGAHP